MIEKSRTSTKEVEFMRILVVEDEEQLIRLYRRVIEDEEHELVSTATNGEDALPAYRECSPDLVLMDNSMPRKTGLETLRDIREEFSDARIVICSSDDVGGEAIEAGAVAYLRKPFRLQQLRDLLRRLNA